VAAVVFDLSEQMIEVQRLSAILAVNLSPAGLNLIRDDDLMGDCVDS
jgi:hypothetical protein